MNPTFSRRHMLIASVGVALGYERSAVACEVITDRLRVTHPWTRATLPGATWAVLGMRLDEVSAGDRLIGARTPVADSALMWRDGATAPLDIPLAPGDTIDMHVGAVQLRLVGLRHALPMGRDYPISLDFEHSGVVHARLTVEADDYEPVLSTAPAAFGRRITF